VSAVRLIGKASAAASDVNALHRALGCLSASGEIRSMYSSSIVIVAGFWLFGTMWALRAARLSTYNYCTYLQVLYLPYIVPFFYHGHPFSTKKCA
jgi:hypothetical protein